MWFYVRCAGGGGAERPEEPGAVPGADLLQRPRRRRRRLLVGGGDGVGGGGGVLEGSSLDAASAWGSSSRAAGLADGDCNTPYSLAASLTLKNKKKSQLDWWC